MTFPPADAPTAAVPQARPYAVVAVGELLVDLAQVGFTDRGAALYERNPGGAPANLAAAVAKLGLPAAFAGVVGDDPLGAFAVEALAACGVDTSLVRATPEASTTLAFATLGPDGGFSYSFARRPGADQLLSADDLPADLPARARALHAGTLALTNEPARSAVLTLARRARELGTLVSCDVNYRPHAWPDEGAAREAAFGLMGLCDLVKVNGAEALMLTGEADPGRAARALLGRGPALVAVTLAAEGALLATRAASARVEAPAPDEVRDTAGAGDSFWGAALAWLLRAGVSRRADLERLDAERLAACGRYACAAASLTVESPGGMSSSPAAAEVEVRLGRAEG